jgi:hypothetical protein
VSAGAAARPHDAQTSSQLRGSLVAALLAEQKTVALLRFVRSGGRVCWNPS